MAGIALKLKITPRMKFIWDCDSLDSYIKKLTSYVEHHVQFPDEVIVLLQWVRTTKFFSVNGTVQFQFKDHDCRCMRLELIRTLIETLRRKGDIVLEEFAYQEAQKLRLLF
ncbi:hypothetical protein COT97_04055 [Candidatus Falkowbacteria bacterium CG10_big_fil_rev_8_21_14_0_10_39_11]|uniref:Uncharacterized protein n=1 Tax=Candidatus Falkowbacteria bacterium CG10_big_fil_rev_8_21_14_0_10_39_11 TaxID=1974565 RepID=A0A2H0V6B4_9BACT|nr:MAG: hypothetical protein COT97_04055 [Candidatus Falkowbacteria bacterium CG10_big_fil_rev_8_21_14_0_10_39_11]